MVTVMQRWYYQLFDEEFGPVTEDVLRELVSEGTLSGSDLVRRGDSNKWEVADTALLDTQDIDAMLSEVPAASGHAAGDTDEQIAQSLSDISFVFEDNAVMARAEAKNGSSAAIADGPIKPPQSGSHSGNASRRPTSRKSRARDAEKVNAMIEESLFSDDEPTLSDDGMFTPHAPSVAPAPYRPKFETRTFAQPVPQPEQTVASEPAGRKSALVDVVQSALDQSESRQRRRSGVGTAPDRMKLALLCVLLLVFGGIQFRGSIAGFFRNPIDRYATRTQLAIAALEAVDAELQSVTWRSQVDSISRELGFYKQLLEAQNSSDEQNKAVIAAISKVLATSELKPEDVSQQRMLLDEARNHLQAYWRG